MKEDKTHLYYLIAFISGFSLACIMFLLYNEEAKDYGKRLEGKKEGEYKYNYPILSEIKPYHPNIKNNFIMREFTIGTTNFVGELNGYGRTPFAYGGLKNNHVDQDIIEDIVKNALKEHEQINKVVFRNKLDSLLRFDVYKGKNRKQRSINFIMKSLNY
tara:strand:+ start:2197 stop:2673 length:477 start_codon:yes stop_codon:yes gene_type:complete